MTDEPGDPWAIPAGRYPGPVCRYDTADGTPTVRAVDDAFEREFGVVAAGTPVADCLASLGLAVEAGDVDRVLAEGGDLRLGVADGDAADGRTYHVRAIPPEGDEQGFLLLVEADALGDDAGALGVDHVASVVSHDLRNPLDVARTRLRAGREHDEPEHFDYVEQAHDRMERIIEDVLTLARGETVVEPDQTVDLGTVAERAWDTVDTGEAALRVDGPLPTTVADPDRVSRLFENLFRNAVEHGSTGPDSQARQDTAEHGAADGSVTVAVGPLDDADGFYVADDGVGIPADRRERAFEPGYSTDEHGAGLGLAIVARIADLHGWTRQLVSPAGGGTRVEFRGVEPAGEADPED
ncbi:sensor histidine kinase [Halostella litorea]|uniref:sensor histidine kinase n=1 Tax=Halostella litorea TaxID=2528831 RepID=UPI001093255C|nr:HAMP domain-containing sensor histidine kinase [Halostella litorea]